MLNPFQLARLAECASPDTDDSPGAVFLSDLLNAFTEDADRPTDPDYPYEAADQAVYSLLSRGTYRFYQTATDLAAYREIPDLADEYGPDLFVPNPSTGADPATNALAIALYTIAARLLTALQNEED